MSSFTEDMDGEFATGSNRFGDSRKREGSSKQSGSSGSNNNDGNGKGDGGPGNSHVRVLEDEEEVDNEYYDFLHVSRTASQEEITAAYKRLTRHFHPDKHLSTEKKKNAELLFGKLNNAYEVLNDPQKRAIYDCLGKEGLKEKGWEIVQKTKTPQEIREEYERLAKARAEMRLQQRTNPTSYLQMTVNATELFERYHLDESLDDVIESTIPSLEISEIALQQTIEMPLSNTDTVTFSGDVRTSNGSGSGSVGCNYRSVTSDESWFELSTNVGSGLSFGGRVFKKLSTRTFFNMKGALQFSSRGLIPSFNATLQNSLTKTTMGHLGYSTKWRVSERDSVISLDQEESGMFTMLERNGETYYVFAKFQLGVPNTFFLASVTKKFYTLKDPSKKNDKPVKLRAVLKFGTIGAFVEYGVDRRLTPNNTIGASMIIGIPYGVTLRVRFSRSTQTYVFPFHLADEVLLQPIIYGTVTPLLLWYSFKKLVLDPYETGKEIEEQKLKKETNLARVAEARKEAQASTDLMRERFSRIRSEEKAKGGFVVLLAVYGKVKDDSGTLLIDFDRLLIDVEEDYQPSDLSSGTQDPLEMIDVTIPVQCLVENSKLIFFEGNHSKADLPGFYDPCSFLEDERKSLVIRYLFQGNVHQVVLDDHESARLPKSSNRI